jgi:hypothetical protein
MTATQASVDMIREAMEDRDILALREAYKKEVAAAYYEYVKGISESIEFSGFQETQDQILKGFQRRLKVIHHATSVLMRKLPKMLEQIAKEIAETSGEDNANPSNTTSN